MGIAGPHPLPLEYLLDAGDPVGAPTQNESDLDHSIHLPPWDSSRFWRAVWVRSIEMT
jgi:hypothetical protein